MNYLESRLALKNGTKPEKERKYYVIPRKSKKKIKEHKDYIPFVVEYLSRPENKYCAIRWENCTGLAECINHLKRRFKSTVMNEEFIEPSCSVCNIEIENDDKRARREGHLLSKFN